MPLSAEEIESAWGFFGATTYGRNARVKLVEVLSSTCPTPDIPSALSRHEGRRTLARELLLLMDKDPGYDGRDGTDDYPSPGRKPVDLGRGPSRRRVKLSGDDISRREALYDAERDRAPGK